MTAKIRQAKTHQASQAKVRRTAPARQRKSCDVIAFPVFERYGDEILEWLSAIAYEEPARPSVVHLVKSMRHEAASLECVRKSVRHNSLAALVRHAANALEASEWDGARYLLITALGLVTPCSESVR